MDQVYMDIPAVRNMAKQFGQVGEVLQQVTRTLQMLVNILKATAFVGLVGGAAVGHFIETVKPHIDEMARKCEELSQDLDASVTAFENGDQQGATRFY